MEKKTCCYYQAKAALSSLETPSPFRNSTPRAVCDDACPRSAAMRNLRPKMLPITTDFRAESRNLAAFDAS